jgi:hypothetical protein
VYERTRESQCAGAYLTVCVFRGVPLKQRLQKTGADTWRVTSRDGDGLRDEDYVRRYASLIFPCEYVDKCYFSPSALHTTDHNQ